MADVENKVPAVLQEPPAELQAQAEPPAVDEQGRRRMPAPVSPRAGQPSLHDMGKSQNERKAKEDEELIKLAEGFQKKLDKLAPMAKKRVIGMLK